MYEAQKQHHDSTACPPRLDARSILLRLSVKINEAHVYFRTHSQIEPAFIFGICSCDLQSKYRPGEASLKGPWPGQS